jgi:hypothetical protein
MRDKQNLEHLSLIYIGDCFCQNVNLQWHYVVGRICRFMECQFMEFWCMEWAPVTGIWCIFFKFLFMNSSYEKMTSFSGQAIGAYMTSLGGGGGKPTAQAHNPTKK